MIRKEESFMHMLRLRLLVDYRTEPIVENVSGSLRISATSSASMLKNSCPGWRKTRYTRN